MLLACMSHRVIYVAGNFSGSLPSFLCVPNAHTLKDTNYIIIALRDVNIILVDLQHDESIPKAKERRGKFTSPLRAWQPTRLNGWNSVCSLLHHCSNQAEEPCEPPKRCSTNSTSQAIKTGQGSVYVHDHCHEELSSTQQHKPPSGRALEMLQARPPADCVLLKGSYVTSAYDLCLPSFVKAQHVLR